jgi:DNA-binding transcriptional LysR family regulator
MQLMIDWDLLRYLLVVHRAGSMAAAARHLRVDQTTVGRRVATLERQLGVQLFRRTRAGYAPTAAAAEIAECLTGAEASIEQAYLRLAGRDARLEGRVRITTTDLMATPVLQSLRDFRAAQPRVEIELIVDNRRLDLGKGEADLAVRMARPREPRLIGRRLGPMRLGVFASATYLRNRPAVRPGQLDGHDVLAFALEMGIARDPWVVGALRGGVVVVRSNSVLSLTRAAAADLGVAVLPCVAAEVEPSLVRVGAPHQAGEIWLALHRDLRATARVRAVFEHLQRSLRGFD